MEQNNTKKSRIIRENNQISEPDSKSMVNDTIDPIQLIYHWDDDCGNGGEYVLGTFTSRLALGLFLADKMLGYVNDVQSYRNSLDNLHLKKIVVNPEYEEGKC